MIEKSLLRIEVGQRGGKVSKLKSILGHDPSKTAL